MKYKVPTIIGSLSEVGTDFIEEKLRLGCKYYSGAYIVREFSLYCECHPEYTEEHCIVTKRMVEEWLQSRSYLSTKTVEHKATVVRHLALFMNRNGETAYVLPKRLSAITKNYFVPYIFTEQQLAEFFAAADAICPSNISPYRHLTMPLLFRLIYGCGLRIAEATKLRICDVDLENGMLNIINTKFGKNRNIPMAESLRKRCLDYHKIVHANCKGSDAFFSNFTKEEYSHSAIYNTFRQLLKECNIGRVNHGPRIHDLRHTYAVHTLKKWVALGYDLSSALPLLSAYMGHSGLSGTQRYLRLTSDLYPVVCEKMESAYGDIFLKEGECNE